MTTFCIEQRSQVETDILLIRHGETDWNLENKAQGTIDIPLNPNGLAQAEKLARNMLRFHSDIACTIYSSNLVRAYDTAQKTVETFKSAGIQINAIVTKKDLREFEWGALEGKKISDKAKQYYHEYSEKLQVDYPSRKQRWNHPAVPEEGVECLNRLVERTKRALGEICRTHPGEKIAVFAHGKLINTLIIDAEDRNTDQLGTLPNCAVVHFRYNPENPDNPLRFLKVENLMSISD